MFVKSLLALLFVSQAFGQGTGSLNIGCFGGGINDADSPATISSCESPDAINVEANLQGTALLKRRGFSNTANLSCSTCPITGSHSFIDASGNRLDIVCQDRSCYKSTNGNAFVSFFSTAAAGVTRWSFVDVGGSLYGANNRYDHPLVYDGTTRTHPAGIPQGSILEMTQSRLAVGDISGNPNRVYYSSAGAYTDFTAGVNSWDPWFDDIGSSGDKVRGLKYFKGNLYIFKTNSITSCELGDQYTTRCAVIVPNLGTTDPASIITAGDSLYFRGQDKNYWEISGNGIKQISAKIPNLVKSQSGGLGGGENSNTQTSAADWAAGSQFPASSWDTATSPGSVLPSSFTAIDTSSSDFAAGTLPVVVSSFGIPSLVSGQIFQNSGSELNSQDTNWTDSGNAWDVQTTGTEFSCVNWAGNYAISQRCGTGANETAVISVLDTVSGIYIYSSAISGAVPGSCAQGTIDMSTQTGNSFKLEINDSTPGSSSKLQSAAFAKVDKILYATTHQPSCTSAIGRPRGLLIDFPEPFYVKSGTFTSRTFDIGFSTPTWGLFNVNMSSANDSGATFATQSSPDGNFSTTVSATPGSKIGSAPARYIRYLAYLTSNISTKTATVNDVSLNYATTGQFQTACIQPNSSISAWGTLSCAQTTVGNGSLVYYATSAATCAGLPTGGPLTWGNTATNNATLAVATNTAVMYGWRSLLGSATDQAQIDACTLAWNEGTPTQPSWAVYDSVKNAVYWTSTINGAASANRLLKYDRNLESWYPFDIAAQAPRMILNNLYFGGAAAGTWNKYGDVDSDAGANINAYWKTKDVGSDTPFLEKSFETFSLLAGNQSQGVLYSTITFSNSETRNFSTTMSTGTGINYIRSNNNIPEVSGQNFINATLGNNSNVFFQILGLGFTWSTTPWYPNSNP